MDAMMDAAGMKPDSEMRKQMEEAKKAGPIVVEYCLDEKTDNWSFKVDMKGYKMEKSFKLNEEFDFMGFGGVPVKSLIKWDGTQFVEVHKAPSKGWESHYIRKIEGDTMTITMTLNGVTAVQTMKR